MVPPSRRKTVAPMQSIASRAMPDRVRECSPSAPGDVPFSMTTGWLAEPRSTGQLVVFSGALT